MRLKTAEAMIEDEAKDLRASLLRSDVRTRGELRKDGYESDEIDEAIRSDKEDVEEQVAEYRAERLRELPEFTVELAERRVRTFTMVAFDAVWLPECLERLDGESSDLTTKEVYEAYLAWCAGVGIDEPYSLGKMRAAVKRHYGIENIRAGLREYRLVSVATKVNRDDLVARHEADERKREQEEERQREQEERKYEQKAAKLRDLLCQYCQTRKYDGNRFDRCYWCSRILKVGFRTALSEYQAEDVGWERTGRSMRQGYQRMIDAGEIPPDQLATGERYRMKIAPSSGKSSSAKRSKMPGCAIIVVACLIVLTVAAACGACS